MSARIISLQHERDKRKRSTALVIQHRHMQSEALPHVHASREEELDVFLLPPPPETIYEDFPLGYFPDPRT